MAIATPSSTEATGVSIGSSLAFAARFLLIGMYFGFVLVKAEVLSWYRIQEMFRFHSFHMYGVIGLAVAVGMLTVWLIERYRLRSLDGQRIAFEPKDRSFARYGLGGSLFGVGWALTGACPGPIAALIGAGLAGFTAVLASAVLGTWTYGLLRHRLPH
jgi:uncharacterized protein